MRPGRPCRRSRTRLVWWHELLLVAVLYGAYSTARNTVPARDERARRHGLDVLDVERHLHIDIERAVNRALALRGPHALAVGADYAYALSHFVVTITVLVWLFRARSEVYRLWRSALVLATVLAIAGYWLFPLAPPRLYPELGYVDTVVRDRTWGSWGSGTISSLSNQYAAMPSVHVVWSAWCGAVLAVLTRRWWIKVVGALYPIAVLVVIVATANHWVLDAAGGLAALGVAAAALLAARHAPPRCTSGTCATDSSPSGGSSQRSLSIGAGGSV